MPISVCTSSRHPSTYSLKEHTNIDRFFQMISPFVKVFLSRRQTSEGIYSFRLSDLWKFYDRPFGLPVPLKNERGTRLHVSFVPTLSAVQLFCDYSKAQESVESDSDRYVQFSATKPMSVVSRGGRGIQPSCKAPEGQERNVSEEELKPMILFQHFERQPPERRVPAFLKVKELSAFQKGHPLWDSQSADLHQESWFCIGWTPVLSSPDCVPFRGTIFTYHYFRLREKNFYRSHPLLIDRHTQLERMMFRVFEEGLSPFSSVPSTIPHHWQLFYERTVREGDSDEMGSHSGESDVFHGFVPLFGYFPYNIRKDAWFLPDPDAPGRFFHPRYHFRATVGMLQRLFVERGVRHPDYDYCAERMGYPRIDATTSKKLTME